MPQISQKALLSQLLQDIWLWQRLVDLLPYSESFDAISQVLLPSGNSHDVQMRSAYPATIEIAELFYEGEGSAFELINGIIGEREGGGDEMDEVIEVLGVIIPEIRYLSPRTPIPLSVYLFTHLVSKHIL